MSTLNDDGNRNAVDGLLADAKRTVALVNRKEFRGTHESVPTLFAEAQRNYVDLVRRGESLTMTDGQRLTFYGLLDHLKEALWSLSDAF